MRRYHGTSVRQSIETIREQNRSRQDLHRIPGGCHRASWRERPTAGLDPKERVRFRNLIAELGKDSIVILSTHIVSDVEHIADRILMMKDGQFIYDGTLEGIGMDLEDIHGIRFATEHRQNDLPPLSAGSRQ